MGAGPALHAECLSSQLFLSTSPIYERALRQHATVMSNSHRPTRRDEPFPRDTFSRHDVVDLRLIWGLIYEISQDSLAIIL